MSEASQFDADFLIIGSGFGGSVSALRLAQKGYRVIVVERGRRWQAEDFPKTNWNLRKSVWAPRLGCHGPLRLSLLDDVLVLSAAGVGGGSLVYANTLLTPPEPFFRDPQWASLADWQSELAPHYATARKMLGAVPNPVAGRADDVLRRVAEDMGMGDRVQVADVGVYFGEAGQTVPDPYFGGEGPDRTGCTQCGACMTGCKHGAKNTLDRNYLYLAERLGVSVVAEREAVALRCIGGPDQRGKQGWEVVTRSSHNLSRWFRSPEVLRARQVVCAAGVLGTLPLLMRSVQAGLLAHMSAALGDRLRTNSEAIVGATARDASVDYSKGVAITSGAFFDDHTHIEVVRYGERQDLLGMLATLLVDGGGRMPRALRWLGTCVRHPLRFARSLWPFGWARKSIILLAMQTLDTSLRARWRRSRVLPWRRVLGTEVPKGHQANPTYLPVANEVAKRVAAKIGGDPVSSLNEVVLDVPMTAHILGGCPIGPESVGVLDAQCRVYGYEGLRVCDGSMIPANMGVNPSLTITALTEHAMAAVPAQTKQP